MVSLNYKNNVIKCILKEEFNAKEYENKISEIIKVIEKLKRNSYSDACYILTSEKGFLSFCIPSEQVLYSKCLNKDDYNVIKASYSVGVSTPLPISEPTNQDEEGYIDYFPFYKLNISASKTLDYNVEKKCMVFAYSKDIPSRNPEIIMNKSKYKRISIDEIKNSI